MTTLETWLQTVNPWKREKYRMVERFREENKTCQPGQILFAGSSLMEMFPVEAFAREEGASFPTVYNRGVGGWRTDDMLPMLDALVTDLRPARLFINIGTNDLSDPGVTVDDLITRYADILARILQAVPGVDVTLMAYYPVNYEAASEELKPNLRIRTNERIREANRAVRALADQQGFRYLDVNQPITDDRGNLRADYTLEGMHINEAGYRAIWPLVKAAILSD